MLPRGYLLLFCATFKWKYPACPTRSSESSLVRSKERSHSMFVHRSSLENHCPLTLFIWNAHLRTRPSVRALPVHDCSWFEKAIARAWFSIVRSCGFIAHPDIHHERQEKEWNYDPRWLECSFCSFLSVQRLRSWIFTLLPTWFPERPRNSVYPNLQALRSRTITTNFDGIMAEGTT